MNTDLQRLKVLTDTISTYTRLPSIEIDRAGSFVRWDVINGECFGLNLKHEDEIAVVDSFMSAGTFFPKHAHKQTEVLHIYKGSCVIETNGEEIVLDAPAVIQFEPNQEHSAKAVTNVWMIGVTVPADKGYPDGSKGG